MGYELVIFDNDGVLVDSEPISNAILAEYLTELGHPTTYEESVRDYMGAALHRVHDTVLERSGRRLPAEFDRAFQARVFAAFERELKAVSGAREVLEGLRGRGVRYCVASSGSHERIRVGHRVAGLDPFFDDATIFSAEDVRKGKPAPDLFHHAGRVMAAPPERCVVIEDSGLGVQAALAAGMTVLGYTAMTPPERLAGATALFDDMKELSGLLAELGL
ncbi:HAD family hydrolase [Streptomyces sp. NPDC046876]|uniref:HAD family hydrolase n=1 Tax=Streptomyces sp. NPDC046876 TaxID=3155616 RepID=UPI0033EFAC55